ncbi:3D domain-containing protein [Virgibacillus oceani]|uniref:Cell wall-binding protein YocH n=1 Tax=Virgibacillus oceani TaxID=1479511 RepID=A0A917M185_9BACI|nr:3D domain-containing protein [Virgibacillus oceani]GGG71291.1 cell wall-binding protein YocH [Virgibacillus oceani]
MKKLVAALATSVIIAGAAATSVSAEEYEVKKDDTLWDIANEYDTTVDDLVDINELKTTVIHPKQKLFINETYMVEKGDTLIGIGKKFDVTVDDIKEWNNLESDVIVIGQEIEIKGKNIVQEDKPSNKIAKNANTQKTSNKESKSEQDNSPDGKTISVKATAYTAGCDGCSGVTSTGVNLTENPNAKVIAVDPNVIPLGSEVYVEGYGYATAADIGGGINGNEIDIHVPTKDDAYNWGVRTVDVTIINK